jgi:S1-C subfamily serine protease
VPISAYLDHWQQLASGETLGLGAPWMGVRAADGENSATVSSIHAGSPAEQAGVHVGDIITHFDGQSVQTFKELKELVQLHKPGDQIGIRIRRGEETILMRVKLGQRGL